MNNKKQNKRSISTKALILALAAVLVIGCTIGGTIAYLVSKPAAITNVFTIGNINAELAETETAFHIVPGVDIAKDPVATVKANSENCYLFAELTEANWPAYADANGRKVNYAIADGWTKLEEGVYYREVPKSGTDSAFHILKDDKVTVSTSLTKTEAEEMLGNAQPKLTVTVYAVQKAAVDSAAQAWTIAKGNN